MASHVAAHHRANPRDSTLTMGKVIFWIVLAFVVLFAVRLYGAAQAKKRRDQDAQRGAGGPMVRCAKCGVFLPRADALPSPDGFRCREPNCKLPP
jgi:uncharacterized protein